jgi:hypothetical protein
MVIAPLFYSGHHRLAVGRIRWRIPCDVSVGPNVVAEGVEHQTAIALHKSISADD